MQHVLVTGGAGFIGSHLCDRLLERGYCVTAIDNLITGRLSNLTQAKSNPNFHWVQWDVSESLPIDQIPALSRFGLHGVFHFACPASPVDFDKIPFEILKVDSLGTINTVNLATQFNARYLLASTSEVYGDPLVHPQTETYWGNVNPIGPRACYDETKRFAEAYVSTANRLKNFRGGIVRIFNTYGPRMRIDDGRIVPELCRQALKGHPLTLHGDGKQTRSFCFVSDLVDGVLKLFDSNLKDPVNIGNPQERTLLEFASILKGLTSSELKTIYLDARLDDPKRRCPDITRAQKYLDWTPQVDLTEGLKLCLEYFRTQL